MSQRLKENIIIAVFAILLVGSIIGGLSIMSNFTSKDHTLPYLVQCDGDTKEMVRKINGMINNLDPEVSGKHSSFITVGASGKLYYISVEKKDENKNNYQNVLGVEFSREEAIDILIGYIASSHNTIPDRKNYLFVKEAMDSMSDMSIEALFYRRYYIPLAIVQPDNKRSLLNECDAIDMRYNMIGSSSIIKEQKWMKDNLGAGNE